jgi:hypothetical protein
MPKRARTASIYTGLIKSAIADTEQKDVDPILIEEMMRTTFRTLDNLRQPAFNKAARAAALALHLDPAFAKMMAEDL